MNESIVFIHVSPLARLNLRRAQDIITFPINWRNKLELGIEAGLGLGCSPMLLKE